MTIERAALGRIGFIGDLYDARTDNFAGGSIFKEDVPQELLSITNCSSTNVSIAKGNDYCEKLSKLDVNADLQVSMLTGLFPPENSFHYRMNESTSRTVESLLTYRIFTKEEILGINHKDVMQYVTPDGMESMVATHVVTGISWGANLILSISSETTNNEDAQNCNETIEATMKTILDSITGASSVDLNVSKIDQFQVKMYSDVSPNPEKCLSSLPEIVQYIKELPSVVKMVNNGKGQPLRYHLTPFNLLKDDWNIPVKANVTYEALGNDTLSQLVQAFDQLASTKQCLNDCHQDFKSFWYCVTEKDKQAIETLIGKVKINETNFRQNLASAVLNFRSGKSDVTELENLMKEFEDFSQKAKDLLDKRKTLVEKVNFARHVVASGVKYIGIGASLDDEILRNFDQKAVVIYFTQTSGKEDVERWKENKRLFFQRIKKKEPNVQFFVVDCDIHPTLMPSSYKNSSCIRVLQSGRVITEDYLEENSKVQISPRAQATQEPEKILSLPKKLVTLAIPCVGIFCNSQQVHNWICKKCGELFHYGFDFHVYCACGKSVASSLEFKCPDVKHGAKFQLHANINQLLEQLQPPEEINILILGETGVGKSTWINGFINYLHYGSIQEAQSGELLTLVPSEFTVCNPTPNGFEQIVVQTGQDKNEVFKSGQSATQTTKVYPIPIGNTIVRLIDTPGIGDTRGIDQDKKNFQNILTTLSHLDEIHGICILLKPNSARLTIMFRFCIKELLTYLHRDASKNIVFCFTNSRSTLYKPGDTFPALNTLLKENKEVEIVVSPNTVYCYDSEAYRFLAAMKNDPPVLFDEGEKENFAKSWERSIIETKRMIKYISSLKPHPIRDTLNLNHAREMVLKLTRPLAEISRNIQTNKANLNDELEEIEKTDENISELRKNKFTTITEIQSQPVDHPKTVCAHGNCVKVWKIGSITTNEYVKVCHDKCQLKDVQRDSLGDPGLMQCWALHQTGGQRCCVCGHDYKIHLHVYYDSIQVPKQVEDQAVKEALKNKLDAKQMKKNMISLRKRRIDKFEEEQKQIERASAKFAYFLRKNAITPYNDEMEQYLSHLIREEKDKVAQGGNVKALECLKLSMSSYLEEKRVLETEMSKEGGEGEGLTPREVEELVEKLKGLELTGTSLKEALDCVEKTRLVVYQEETINPNIELFWKGQTWGFWERSKTKAKNFFGVWF